MNLKIFIDKKNFDFLKRSIPAASSNCLPILKQAIHLANACSPGSATAVITCEVAEARALLNYARRCCPGAAATIAEAIRDEGLTP